MKKVVYSVSKQNRFGSTKMTGLGFITESDLIIACTSKNGKAYIRVFEDCVKNCHEVFGKNAEMLANELPLTLTGRDCGLESRVPMVGFPYHASDLSQIPAAGISCQSWFIARSPADLIREGEMLDHCVGRMNYDMRVIREQSLIFFIRTKQHPDTPFVTVEYSLQSHKVLQCYGEHDHRPSDDVLHYVNKVWLPYANKTLKKLAA